jgi:hypothetical protein
VDLDIGVAREAEVRAVGRVADLVGRQLLLGGEGEPSEVVPPGDVPRVVDADSAELGGVEGIGPEHLVEHQLELSELELTEGIATQCLHERADLASVHVCLPSQS